MALAYFIIKTPRPHSCENKLSTPSGNRPKTNAARYLCRKQWTWDSKYRRYPNQLLVNSVVQDLIYSVANTNALLKQDKVYQHMLG